MQTYESNLMGADRPCAPSDCLQCQGRQKLHKHGCYRRLADASGDRTVPVRRLRCPACLITLSVIPEGMFPRRSLPIAIFEASMNAEFGSDAHPPEAPGAPLKKPPEPTSADDGARPPPASEVIKGCLLRTRKRLNARISHLRGLLGQRMPLLGSNDLRGFWRALSTWNTLTGILHELASSFNTSLFADYLSFRSPHCARG